MNKINKVSMRSSHISPPHERTSWLRAGRGISETLAILLVLALALTYSAQVLALKDGREHVLAGQKDPDGTYDVIFAGGSHMNDAVFPMELYADFGFSAFNNAQNGENIPVSYYTCQYAIETYRPRVLVLDLYYFTSPGKTAKVSWMHQSLDRLSAKYRIPAILDLVPEENRREFLVPTSLYHARWKDLRKSDFVQEDSVYRGGSLIFTAEDLSEYPIKTEFTEQRREPNAVPAAYLDKIRLLCEETGTQLLLVALPYLVSEQHEDSNKRDFTALFNWVGDYAQEHGIGYLNFFPLIEELGLDWSYCLKDYSHLNYWGGTIVTAYLGEYLASHYDLPDHRGESTYAHWDKDLERYRAEVEQNLKKTVKE